MSRKEFFKSVVKDTPTEELAKIANRLRKAGESIPTNLLDELIQRKDYVIV